MVHSVMRYGDEPYCINSRIGAKMAFGARSGLAICWRFQAHRRTGQFFLGGLSHPCRKIFFDSAGKNRYANLQNYFALLTPPSNY